MSPVLQRMQTAVSCCVSCLLADNRKARPALVLPSLEAEVLLLYVVAFVSLTRPLHSASFVGQRSRLAHPNLPHP